MVKPLPGAYPVLGLLFVINILNYLDRQVLYAVLPLVKTDLRLSDTQLGALASAFMLVYMCAAVPIAYVADRTGRKRWIAGGLALWSSATLLTGLTRNYFQLFLSRAAVGIGESCYGSVSPSFVAEHFPPSFRGRALAFFSMAVPVGSALGYVFGGLVGHRFGWRAAFLWAGALGLPLALLTLRLADPRERTGSVRTIEEPSHRAYAQLFRNKSFLLNTLAMAAMTFAMGGLAVWMPTYFHRKWGMNVSQAGALFGLLTVAGGIAGSLLGGWLADKMLRFTSRAYFLVSGLGLCLSLPFGAFALTTPRLWTALAALGVAETLAFLNMGPLTAVITTVTPLPVRTMAFAVNIFVIHALGDAVSPTLIGYVSDLANLQSALLGAILFLGIAGALCLWGMKFYDQDMARASSP